MLTLLRMRTTHLWFILVALTLCSAELMRQLVGRWGELPFFAVVLAITFAKVRIVGLDYMELRRAPLPLRFLFEGWLVIVTLGMLSLLAGAGTGFHQMAP